MAEPTGEKPKLIIDEGWKSQVEREREELRKAKEQAAENTANETGSASSTSASTDAPFRQADAAQPATSQSAALGAGDKAEPHSAAKPSGGNSADATEIPPPPPATFPFLVSMLGTQALVAMGQLAEDGPEIRLDYAKHYIDLLGLLEEKTKGNLSQEESSLLFDWLHQLRLGFVEVAKRQSR